VRVPDLAYPYLAQPLDAGAQGIMLPRVYSADQVKEAVQIMKYAPLGARGCAFARGSTAFKGVPIGEGMASANEETMLIVQIETEEAIENSDEILAVPGVDVAFVGPTDLSIALGVPGQTESPVLVAAIEQMIATCQRHGVVPGVQMNDIDLAVRWAGKGMRLISSMSEIALMVSAGSHLTSVISGAFA
jgi:2-keto-3-deoxy-L-rhamnonate aldolase RhmA